MNHKFKLINENEILNNYPFYSIHNFNCIYKYNNKFALIEFNQTFSNSIICKSKYYNSLNECLNNINFKDDFKFVNYIIFKN